MRFIGSVLLAAIPFVIGHLYGQTAFIVSILSFTAGVVALAINIEQ